MQYESGKIEDWFSGDWISDDEDKLKITFHDPQNVRIVSPSLPEFDHDGRWTPMEIPMAFRFREIQITAHLGDSESLLMQVTGDSLYLHRYSSRFPSGEEILETPAAPPPLKPVSFKRVNPSE